MYIQTNFNYERLCKKWIVFFVKLLMEKFRQKKLMKTIKILAFYDIAPQAPVHIVIIPKEHVESMNGVTSQNSSVVAHIFEVIPKIAEENNLGDGYRVVSNCGENGGQTVFHLHFHLLGGKMLNTTMV